MPSQGDIDDVLNDAQAAVDNLIHDVNGLEKATPKTSGNPPAPPAGETTHTTSASPATPPSPTLASPDIARILKLRVPVVVRLAERQMPLCEILKIVPGTILEFDRRVDEQLDLLANKHQIGSGVAVKVNEQFGLRVTYIGDIKQRIRSLAG